MSTMTTATVREESAIDSVDPWCAVLRYEELESRQVVVVRPAGKQIALFMTPGGVRACNNRCPHEGYPLSEGTLAGDEESCALTCNWHNWKFDLESGANAYGGDRLRVYPVEVREGWIWVDLSDPPRSEVIAGVKRNLRDAFDDHDYARLAREVARLLQAGGDPMDALRWSIDWSWQRLEFGWTHAYAGMADWLVLYEEHEGDAEARLACLVEAIGHAAFDVLREGEYPYADTVMDFDADAFCEAIEIEDEASAVAMVRGGVRQGLGVEDFEPALARAALAHYNAFGHSLIYVTKLRVLVAKLGERVAEPLLLSLVREIVFAAREDKIPEFRRYAGALKAWGSGTADASCDRAAWQGAGINRSLDLAVESSRSSNRELFLALLGANARNMLHFDLSVQDRVRVTVSNNVDWLDFTHGLTFADAVAEVCGRYPQLWPAGLLQLACFAGRNAGFTDFTQDMDAWFYDDSDAGMAQLLSEVLDHGQAEYIVSVHWLKTSLSVRNLSRHLPAEDSAQLHAALNRFVHSRIKRRNVRRVAHQALSFVAKDQ